MHMSRERKKGKTAWQKKKNFFARKMHCSCLCVFPEARFFRGDENPTKKLDITSGYLLPCGFCRTQPLLDNSLLIGPLALIIQSYCTQTLGKCHNCSCMCLDGDSRTLSPETLLKFNFSQVRENRWFWFPDQRKPVEVTFSQRNAWFTEQRLVLSALILSEKPCILGEHLVCPSCGDQNQRHPCFEVCPGWYMQPILRSLEMKTCLRLDLFAVSSHSGWKLSHSSWQPIFRVVV